MNLPSVTFLGLLNEGRKIEVYNRKVLINIASFPHWELDQKQDFIAEMTLPDDILSDILEIDESSPEEKEQFKQNLNGS